MRRNRRISNPGVNPRLTLPARWGLGLLAFGLSVGCDPPPAAQANTPPAAIPSAAAVPAAADPSPTGQADPKPETDPAQKPGTPAAAGTDTAAAVATGASAGSGEPAGAGAGAEASTTDEGGDETGEQEPPDKAVEVEVTRVLLIGDSLVATGFGVLLEKGLDAHAEVDCFRKGKSATGLARPDFFNWMSESKKQIEFRKPEVVIAIMGGNDGQDLRPLSGKGRGVHWPSEEWNAGYRERMDKLLEQLSADGRSVIWVALPPMGMRSLEKKLVTIRAIQKEAVEALGDRGAYIETASLLTDDDGKLLTYGKVKGKKREIRADDGIHFTMSGSQFFADLVVPQILNQLGVSDVEG